MTINKNGSFRISPNYELHNNRLYKGKDNQISISRVYSADFECKFAMQYYPFDVQQCNMNFILEVSSIFLFFATPADPLPFLSGNLWERCGVGKGYG